MSSASSASLLLRVRTGAVIGSLAAALALTGCSSSDDGDGGTKDKGDGGASAAPSASASEEEDGGAEDGSLEGSWVATTDGKTVALMIEAGGKAALLDSGGTTCSGTGGEEAGMQMIHLKCTDGSDKRGEGMVESVSATTMKVSWEGNGKETFTRSKDGRLPEGLPTKGIPGA